MITSAAEIPSPGWISVGIPLPLSVTVTLEPLVNDYLKLQIIEKECLEAKGLVKESRDDKEMELLAREELQSLELSKNELIQKLTLALLPKDPRDERSRRIAINSPRIV